MVKYNQYLTYSLLATLAGLPIGCLIGGLLIGLYSLLVEAGVGMDHILRSFTFGFSVAIAAAFIGFLPSFLYGAPLYALLYKHNIANVLTVLSIGIIPGLLALVFEPSLAVLFLLFGPCVALATHLFAKRRLSQLAGMGANNSFKPKPLRGSA